MYACNHRGNRGLIINNCLFTILHFQMINVNVAHLCIANMPLYFIVTNQSLLDKHIIV